MTSQRMMLVSITLSLALAVTVYADTVSAASIRTSTAPVTSEGTVDDTQFFVAFYEVPPGHRLEVEANYLHGTPFDLYVIDGQGLGHGPTPSEFGVSPPSQWPGIHVYQHIPAQPYEHDNGTIIFPDMDEVEPSSISVTRLASTQLPDLDGGAFSAPIPGASDNASITLSPPGSVPLGTTGPAEGIVLLWWAIDDTGGYEQIINLGQGFVKREGAATFDARREDQQPAFMAAKILLGGAALTTLPFVLRSAPKEAIVPSGPEESLLDLMQRAGDYLDRLRWILIAAGALLAWAAISITLLLAPTIAAGAVVHGPLWEGTVWGGLGVAMATVATLWLREMARIIREGSRWQSLARLAA